MLAVTSKVRVWPASSAGPALMTVAQPGTDWGPASSFTDWLAPLAKEGTSLTALTVALTVAAAE